MNVTVPLDSNITGLCIEQLCVDVGKQQDTIINVTVPLGSNITGF